MHKYKGEIGLFTATIIWGTGFTVTDIALRYLSPEQILVIRFLISAILLSVIFHKKLKLINKTTLIYGTILGVILYLAFLFQTIGLNYTTVSKNAFITSVNVVIVPFIALIIYRHRIPLAGILGAIIAITGIGVLSFELDLSVNIGDLLTFICAIGYAMHIFYTGDFVKKVPSAVSLTIVQMAVAFLLSLFTVIIKQDFNISTPDIAYGVYASIYLGVFSTSIAFLLQTVSQQYASQTKSAIIMSSEALFGTLFSVILLGERITIRLVVGSVLIISAILITELKPKKTVLNTEKPSSL